MLVYIVEVYTLLVLVYIVEVYTLLVLVYVVEMYTFTGVYSGGVYL